MFIGRKKVPMNHSDSYLSLMFFGQNSKIIQHNAYFCLFCSKWYVPETSKKSGSMLRNLSYYGFYQCLRSGTVPGCHQLIGWSLQKMWVRPVNQPKQTKQQLVWLTGWAGAAASAGNFRGQKLKIVLAPCCTYLVVLQRAVVLHLVP